MFELYQIAEDNKIEVFSGNIPETKSMSVPGAICLDYRMAFSGAEERTHMGHELGHCMTGAFYRRSDPVFIRNRAENKADRWEIMQLVPIYLLRQAQAAGHTDLWDLADYFEVTEDLMEKALYLYQNGHMPPRYKQK